MKISKPYMHTHAYTHTYHIYVNSDCLQWIPDDLLFSMTFLFSRFLQRLYFIGEIRKAK